MMKKELGPVAKLHDGPYNKAVGGINSTGPEAMSKISKNIPPKSDYTTYGLPEHLYTAQGREISTANIDEGNLSAIQRVHKHGESVVVQDDTERFGKGTRLFLNNPMEKKD